jgi:hypothetical protein
MAHLPLFGIAESYRTDSDEPLFVSEIEPGLQRSDTWQDTCAHVESEG